ncbi:MAG: nucleotide exchange factor GrpE [Alphaproteobacteria bacterium]|nr:nucleotide exchange factor GrpE [Alphaproteobacteria bacterium]
MTEKKKNHTDAADKIEELRKNLHAHEKDDEVAFEDGENIAENADENDALAQLQAEYDKLKDSFLRTYAEAENIKKRCQQEIEKNNKYAIAAFAKELLSVADNLQRAVDSVDEASRPQCAGLLEGVMMTQNELTHVFDKFNIKKIDSIGKVFDPNLERVVQEIEDPTKPAGTIVSELQSAYTINDRILREAMVIVTKGGTK